jgi:hypothetical protein
MTLPLNPQPVSGTVSVGNTPNVNIANTPTVNIGNTPIPVTVDAVTAEDSVNFLDDDYDVGSSAFISLETLVSNGTIIEILNFNLYSTDANSVHKVEFKLGTNTFYTFYVGRSFFETINFQITTPVGSPTFSFRISETTVGTTHPSVSIVYRITPP